MENFKCQHRSLKLIEQTMSDGRITLREKCIVCNRNLPAHLPQCSDENLIVPSLKYGEIRLSELLRKDRNYVLWLVDIRRSHYSKRIRLAALRLLEGRPFILKPIGSVYSYGERYQS